MGSYAIQRCLQTIPLLIGISILVFLLINAVPGSPVGEYALNPNVRPEDIARVEEALGLNEPLHRRYFVWLGNVARGDLGESMVNHTNVRSRLLERLPNTLRLTVSAFLLSLAISVPIGVLCAIKRNRWIDHVATLLAVIGSSVPTFWLGLALILLFAVRLRWLPSGGIAPIGGGGATDELKHMILPVFTLAFVQVATWSRYVRSQMIEVLSHDYIRTARAKGLRERLVVLRHGLRNAALPFVTLLGLAIPDLFSGALIIETIFTWPGLGRLTYEAAVGRDYTMVMGAVMLGATLVVIGNLIADLCYGLLDPRIRRR